MTHTGSKVPSAFDLRVFAALLTPFCTLLARGIGPRLGLEQLWLWTGLALLPVSLLGLFRPAAIRGLYRQWIRVTSPIGRAISIVLLSAIYFLIITPMGLCLRLCRVDPAQRRWDARIHTYWSDRPQRSNESYFHPF